MLFKYVRFNYIYYIVCCVLFIERLFISPAIISNTRRRMKKKNRIATHSCACSTFVAVKVINNGIVLFRFLFVYCRWFLFECMKSANIIKLIRLLRTRFAAGHSCTKDAERERERETSKPFGTMVNLSYDSVFRSFSTTATKNLFY